MREGDEGDEGDEGGAVVEEYLLLVKSLCLSLSPFLFPYVSLSLVGFGVR